MTNYKAVFDRIYGILNPNINEAMRVQISRRVLGENFNQILISRKYKSSLSVLSNKNYEIDLERGHFYGGIRLTLKAYLGLFFSLIGYLCTVLGKHPVFSPQHSNQLNLLFGYHFPLRPLNLCEMQLHKYLRNFGISQGIGSSFFVEQTKYLRLPRTIDSSFFTFSPVLSVLISTRPRIFRYRALFQMVLEFCYFLIMIPFLGPKRIVIRDLFLQKWLTDIFFLQGLSANLFCTPNDLFTQNLVFTQKLSKGSRNMIWYSASAMIRDFENEWYIDDSLYYNLPIDCHYVWTNEHASYLRNSGSCQARVVGPQLFYLPSAKVQNPKRKKVIAVMDVTPTSWSLYENTLYSLERGLWFLDQVHVALSALKLSHKSTLVEFKFKREIGNHHAKKYLERVQSLNESGFFYLIDENVNLYDYFGTVDCLITTELTSVGLVAESMGIDVMYLDPFDSHSKRGCFFPRNCEDLELMIRNLKKFA